MGPKTVVEIIHLEAHNPKFNYGMLDYRAQFAVELYLDEVKAYAEDAARTAAKGLTKAQKIEQWRKNKELAAQRSRR